MLNNQRGEAVLALFVLFAALSVGMAHEVRRVEKEAAKDLHYQKYHPKALETEKELKEELEKARLFRI